jgi:hypothetical protein
MWYLQPSYYATPITNISQSDDEAYSVCKGGPPDDWDEALSLNVCGHLIQPWLNKCPICRQEICPPRARRAESGIPDEEPELRKEDEDQESEDGESRVATLRQ